MSEPVSRDELDRLDVRISEGFAELGKAVGELTRFMYQNEHLRQEMREMQRSHESDVALLVKRLDRFDTSLSERAQELAKIKGIGLAAVFLVPVVQIILFILLRG